MVRVKVCGITRVEDALAAAAAGAQALGFVFYPPSPRFVAPGDARAIITRLPPLITRVGLFVDADPAFIHSVLATVPLDVIQFHGDEAPDFCAGFDKPYLKAVRMKPGVDLHEVCARYADASALLLDGYADAAPGGTGTRFDWNRVPPDLPRPVILAGGLTAANVRQAIAACRPAAVDVSSGVELAKGIKDKHAMTEFIREVACADEIA